MIKNKNIFAIDLILLVGTLVVLLGAFSFYNEPVALSPEDGFQSRNTFVLFEFENAQVILIDDNTEFTSPTRYNVEDNFVIRLDPGVYYWKIEGENELREFTIESEVSLRLREENGRYAVVNAGNEELEVDVYEFGELKENVVLDTYSSQETNGDTFIGGKRD